ncbi:MAG: hypothetical protein IKA72_05075 [Clostridia bacterium]|nr:hypothetical protein [Clostridia bacterium]
MDILFIILLNTYLPCSFLSVTAISGFGLVVFLFLFCFLSVHIIVLLKLGWKAKDQLDESAAANSAVEEKKSPEPKEKEREPIYYIVERKRTRPKQNYGEPKEFRFK